MKCHYEILGLQMKANDDEIKKAYRKLALQWHPDKNPDKIEECTKHFNLIQQAYDVLMDPQERAWYDRHRDAILKGGLDEHYEDSSLNLFAYFTSSCYSGYDDDEKGFYTVYRHVFESIVNEDAPFMENQEAEIKRIPTFGTSTSLYDEVVSHFYGHWQGYCTSKSYAWLDQFDIQQAQNRQILRAMEKENKKIRDAARKERNEEVRELVAFVRKRDKRVQAYRRILEEQRVEQMKKTQEHRKTQIQNRLKDMADYKEADWHNSQARQDDLKAIEAQLAQDFGDATHSSTNEDSDGNNSASDDERESGSLYCPACEKAFKTAKAYKNHENSKKHKEGVKLLKQHMTEEEFGALILDQKDDEDGQEEEKGGSRKGKKSKRKQKKKESSDESENEEIPKEDEPKIEETIDVKPVEEMKSGNGPSGQTTSKPRLISDHSDEATTEAKPALCQTCQEEFPSRTKLFNHLKLTGHALLKEQPRAAAKKAGGKKGKKIR